MVVSDLVRAAALAGMAAIAAVDGPAWPVYVLACLATAAQSAFHPAQAAVLPALARTPEELTAANVASGTVATLTGLLGPALGGVLFAASSASVVFAATAACVLLSALVLAGIRVPHPDASPRTRARRRRTRQPPASWGRRSRELPTSPATPTSV